MKESRRVTRLQGVVRKNTLAPGPLWDRRRAPLGIIDGWEQLHVSEFPLDSR